MAGKIQRKNKTNKVSKKAKHARRTRRVSRKNNKSLNKRKQRKGGDFKLPVPELGISKRFGLCNVGSRIINMVLEKDGNTEIDGVTKTNDNFEFSKSLDKDSEKIRVKKTCKQGDQITFITDKNEYISKEELTRDYRYYNDLEYEFKYVEFKKDGETKSEYRLVVKTPIKSKANLFTKFKSKLGF